MKFVFTAVASALLLSATPTMAADSTGFYVGAGIGSFGLDFDLGDGDDFSGDDTSFKVLGGWNFNQFVGGELEYIDGGSPEDWGVGIDVSGWNFSLKGTYPFTEQFNAFAKVGLIAWEVDAAGASDDGNDFSWGIGGGYEFTDNFGARIEYQNFEIEDTDTADLISASVIYKF